ncbi:CsgE family curli-type amyloid fiber assembly protein [Chryseobacterium caseinilyticum]|uniref:Curli production assembly/transport component CsgE n=1 Tax=Chryseobacterium caseinilyticum TaxID=2771428 RepID=A0ABR8ZBM3_9FLAO|nr:CsgE family curli-type amyloid fiber assembly protein [Chryseobacterium caseinilyticum]MBD8082484.1 hypothetical protein [Chryseobacterium caseinilyticum]
MKIKFLWIISMLFCCNFFSQNKTGNGLKAKIITESADGLYNIIATAENQSDFHYPINYILLSIKKGASGNTSTNKQEGKFVVKPKETLKLSEVKTNLDKRDVLKVFLFIKDEESDKVISKDSLEIRPEKIAQNSTKALSENDIELSGLTIDDTRSRNGKYYYDQFYMKYLQTDEKFPGTVKIIEIPGLGQSTRISIMYNEQEIYLFNTSPDEEVMNQEAQTTLEILKEMILPKNELLRSST